MERLEKHKDWVTKLTYGEILPEQYIEYIQMDTDIELEDNYLLVKLRECLDKSYSEMDNYYTDEYKKLIDILTDPENIDQESELSLINLVINFDKFTTILSTCLIIMERSIKYRPNGKGESNDNVG